MRSILSAALISTIAAFLFCTTATGQTPSLQKEVEQLLKDKILTLRAFTQDSRLQFDQAGQLKKQGKPAPWTLYSDFQVATIKLEQRSLKLKGPRIVHLFQLNQMQMTARRSDATLEIELDLPPGAGLNNVADKIRQITVPAESRWTTAPEYWQSYLQGQRSTGSASDGIVDLSIDPTELRRALASGGSLPDHRNPAITLPAIIKQVQPKYPEDARRYGFQGLVVLEAEVSNSGNLTKVSIVIPAGGGLDEAAVESLRSSQFGILELGGKPVHYKRTIFFNIRLQR